MGTTTAQSEIREACYALNRAISRFLDRDEFALADEARTIRDDVWSLLEKVEQV